MSGSYAKGAAFEHRVIRYLQSVGWRVIRSAGSHDDPDLVALRQGRVVLLQCKVDGYHATPAVRAALRDFARTAGTPEAYIVRRVNDRARQFPIELRDVFLWDHDRWDPIEVVL